MALEIRLLKNNEHVDVVDFFNNARNIDHKEQKDFRTLERFEWEFVNGPGGPAVYVIAVENEDPLHPTIVGTQCAIPLIMTSSGKEEIYTAKGEDTLIDIRALKKYRNRDLLKEMYTLLFEECTKRGIQLIWGFTHIPATFQRVGFSSPIFATNAVMVIKPLPAYKYLSALNPHNTAKDKFKILGLSILSTMYGKKGVLAGKIPKEYACTDRTRANMELFYNAVPNNETYYFLKQDDQYTKWRIVDNSSDISYRTKQLFDGNKLLIAEIIYSHSKGIAYIEQMLFSHHLADTIRLGFIRKVISELQLGKSSIIRFVGFENNSIGKREARLLKKAGFIFAKRGASFVIKSLTENKIDVDSLLLSRLYFQGVRQ
jgi:hypothetical protein